VQRFVVVFLAGHGKQVVGVAQAIVDPVQGEHDIFQRPFFAAEFLRAFGVVPDLGIFEFAGDGL